MRAQGFNSPMTVQPPPPWEQLNPPAKPNKRPLKLVDLDRCIGCHACSVACKTEHSEALGSFRMRVRWLPRPDRPSLAFVPVFDAVRCNMGGNRRAAGLEPACVAACPTGALLLGDLDDAADPVSQAVQNREAKPISTLASLHPRAYYLNAEPWMANALGRGVALSPDDPDIIYEQVEPGRSPR